MNFRTNAIQGPFAGKIAFVTGSSFGIGRGIAIKLAQQGASVVVSGRRQTEIDNTIKSIEAFGGKAVGYVLDVSNKAEIDKCFSEFITSLGGLDIFVNNAGITVHCNLIDNTEADIERICRTNLLGATYCIQNAAKLMVKQKSGGSIVVITSVNALAPLPNQTFYSGTKAALEAIVKGLAWELREHNIRVNTVAPGAVESGMVVVDESVAQHAKDNIPMHRIGLPEDIANAVAYIASDDASYVTGTTLLVDGGLMLRKGRS